MARPYIAIVIFRPIRVIRVQKSILRIPCILREAKSSPDGVAATVVHIHLHIEVACSNIVGRIHARLEEHAVIVVLVAVRCAWAQRWPMR